MFQIQTLNKISPCGLALLDPAKYAHNDDVQNPDGILVRSAALHEVQFPASVKAIARAGVGVNNIPVDRCTEEGRLQYPRRQRQCR